MRDEVLRVAVRHGLESVFVTDGGIRPPREPNARLVIVGQGADAADDWIAARAGSGDIAVTADVPLAARCVANGALALKPNGEVLDEKAIGMALATRDLMTGLRETGEIGGGPRPFGKRDRSRFLNALERAVQSCKSDV